MRQGKETGFQKKSCGTTLFAAHHRATTLCVMITTLAITGEPACPYRCRRHGRNRCSEVSGVYTLTDSHHPSALWIGPAYAYPHQCFLLKKEYGTLYHFFAVLSSGSRQNFFDVDIKCFPFFARLLSIPHEEMSPRPQSSGARGQCIKIADQGRRPMPPSSVSVSPLIYLKSGDASCTHTRPISSSGSP